MAQLSVWPATLLADVLVTGAGTSMQAWMENRTFQGKGSTTSGAGAATIIVEGSNDDVNWITLGTITLTLGTAETSDGFASDARWSYLRGRVSAISGTGAKVSLFMGF